MVGHEPQIAQPTPSAPRPPDPAGPAAKSGWKRREISAPGDDRRPGAQHQRHRERAERSSSQPDESAGTHADLVEASVAPGTDAPMARAARSARATPTEKLPLRVLSPLEPRAAGSTTTSRTPASTTPMNTSAPWSSRSPTIGTARSVAIGTLSNTTVAAVCTPQRVIAARYSASATEKPRKPERNSHPHASPTAPEHQRRQEDRRQPTRS